MTQLYGGQPAPVGRPRPTGKLLLSATWQLLRQDRDLLWLPVVGGVASLFVLAMLLVPGLVFGWLAGNASAGGVVGGLLGLFAAATVGIYFQAALVLGAFQRADGFDPSFTSTLQQAWAVRRQVVEWALLTTTIGALIRVVEERLGFVGAIIGFLGGLAWSIASFFTIPVFVAEGLGPVAATRRSAALVKQRWGISVRSTLRLAPGPACGVRLPCRAVRRYRRRVRRRHRRYRRRCRAHRGCGAGLADVGHGDECRVRIRPGDAVPIRRRAARTGHSGRALLRSLRSETPLVAALARTPPRRATDRQQRCIGQGRGRKLRRRTHTPAHPARRGLSPRRSRRPSTA